ncbi:MAG: histidine kinase dimerization/phospho-acceptor domain-containing protein [Desulfuromonadales bacterium]|nr:histidine kinase dimerization/phospho-acceptor domain-containing protein [Desulfuromonadales bacterium]
MQVLREQRLECRVARSLPLRIQFEDANGFSGEMTNISIRGLSCRVPCYVPPFSRLTLILDLPMPTRMSTSLRIDALVVRTEEVRTGHQLGGFLLGLLFLRLNQDKAALISTYLNQLTGCDEIVESTVRGRQVKRPNEACLNSKFNPQEFLQDYKLTRLDRLACLGELSSILAHEIKNPLACLAGSLQILNDEIRDLHPSESLFAELFAQIDRIDNIVDHLLQFSASEAPQKKLLRVEDVINSTLCVMGGKLKEKNIQVDLCHGIEQPMISADERLLRQAFLNIFANVVDSIELGGSFSVNTHWPGKAPVCDRAACECFSGEESRGISVVVMNSGLRGGNSEKRFQPLPLAERKKRGLNLSLTQQIIEQHKGSVFIQNQPEESSVLLVTLPL